VEEIYTVGIFIAGSGSDQAVAVK